MEVIEAIAILLLGLLVLAIGGDLLVRGAVNFALHIGIGVAVAGLTIVAFGTSAPELVVSVLAALRGNNDIAVGNVVGSNIFNIGAVLGISAMVRTLQGTRTLLRLEWPFLFGSTLLAVFLFQDGKIASTEGILFLTILAVFTFYIVHLARKNHLADEVERLTENVEEAQSKRKSIALEIGMIVGGAALLAIGARWMLNGAVDIAQRVGLSERVIGLTIIGAGTGLPELAASVIASIRKQTAVALGNIIGSNAFNILWILGASSLIRPLNVDQKLVSSDIWWMLGLTFVLLPLIGRNLSLPRWAGAMLFATYITYVVLLL